MRSKRFALISAICLLAALALPFGLGAQATRWSDEDKRHFHGDAQITILQTTDIHHHANGVDHVGLDVNPVDGTGLTGAYSRIAAYVRYVRGSAGHPVVLVDSGDWTMGTLYDLTLGSRPLALKFLKIMHYDCVTLGNHEFDYTPSGLALMLHEAQTVFGLRTPIVASNMDLGGDADLAPFVGPGKAIQTTRIETLPNGIKVGFIGLMGRNAAQAAPVSAPVSFAIDYTAIQGLVDGLRRRVDIVIALSHSGTDASGETGEDIELARHVTGIDVIASGHTHTPLAGAHTVMNGGWTTQLIDAGAFGTNVARIDLTYHSATRSMTLDGSSNLAMTDASLASVRRWLAPDPVVAGMVNAWNYGLNAMLGPLFAQTFPDYDAHNLGTGIYHPVGTSAQDMESNGINPVLSPNGLGDLAADGLRSVPNAIIAQTLAAVGGNPANLPGYDFTPYQVAVVASGVLRSRLLAGVPLTFADVYNVLPLGFTPDASQALPVGYPTVSAYLTPEDVQKVCALQLVAQTNLVPSDYYLNLSGLRYGLKAAESYVYFKYATAAAVLQVTGEKAATGSTPALQALGALATLASDHGAGLLAAYAAGNPYATAMVKLNDTAPDSAQIGVNLGTLGEVAAAAAADAAAGTTTLSALIVSKAVAAIDTLEGFAASDSANVGPTTPLPANARVRVAADLYAVLLIGSVESQFGVAITPYAAATGPAVLSAADLPGLLANRIDADPGTAGIQEMKEWMTLLSYVGTGLGGSIPSAYASTPVFADFGSYGAAVQTRNSSYPLAPIAQLVGTLVGLQAAP